MEKLDSAVGSVGGPFLVPSDYSMFSYWDQGPIAALSAGVWEWSKPDDGMIWYLTGLFCCPNAALFLGLELKVDGVQRLYYVKEYDIRYQPGFKEPVSYRYPTDFTITILNLYGTEFNYAWAMSFFEVPE